MGNFGFNGRLTSDAVIRGVGPCHRVYGLVWTSTTLQKHEASVLDNELIITVDAKKFFAVCMMTHGTVCVRKT